MRSSFNEIFKYFQDSKSFPVKPYEIILYGSKVKKQKNSHDSGMIDILVIVDDLKSSDFEKLANFQGTAKHFPTIGRYLTKMLPETFFQIHNKPPAVSYFNGIQIGNFNTKYAIIDRKDFINDLIEWEHFYFAGRTQKPIELAFEKKDILEALEANRKAAFSLVRLANSNIELKLPVLIEKIIGLSYLGDIRMNGFENPKKVQSIYQGQKEELNNIYSKFAVQGFTDKELSSNLPGRLKNIKSSDLINELIKLSSNGYKSYNKKALITVRFTKAAGYLLSKYRRARQNR